VGEWPQADVAVLHVDLSVIPGRYVQALAAFDRVVNGAALDIRKRQVSRNLVAPGDGWDGPVIVKTDLNCGGMPEHAALQTAQRLGARVDLAAVPMAFMSGAYPILPRAADVPAAVWEQPGLVVERFLPERDPHGFALRAWTFFGARERCTRYVATGPIVKSENVIAREPVSVPDEMRAERARLGFDFGKFDFAVHDGRAVLYDANRTPGAPPGLASPAVAASMADLARGIDDWLP
jgi:hypothetical protein